VICALGAFLEGLNHDPSLLTGGLLLALVLGFLYWLTRQNFIVISSPSTSMVIKVKMKKENVRNFVNNVEQARNKRISTLNIRASLTD
jgi:hypothetical protein